MNRLNVGPKYLGSYLSNMKQRHLNSSKQVNNEIVKVKKNSMEILLIRIENLKKEFRNKISISLHHEGCSYLVEYFSSEFNTALDSILQDENFPSPKGIPPKSNL